MRKIAVLRSVLLALASLAVVPAYAADVSTHVLDLATGVGGTDIPVILERKQADGSWIGIASARTDANGRVRAFDVKSPVGTGIYRLRFDISAYGPNANERFFPEIDVTFRVSDMAGHYHVPVVVSPFGYSTYRGN